MIILPVFVFLVSCLLLFGAGKLLVEALLKVARFLEWREFVLSFFIMAMAASLPNLFVGILASLHGSPELSFGDVIGGNIIDFTLAIAIPILLAGGIQIKSRVAQTTALFTIFSALLPLILIWDRKLSRGDGILLVVVFLAYLAWLFSKEERFKLVYDGQIPSLKGFEQFFKGVLKIAMGTTIFLLAAEGIVRSATSLAQELNFSLVFIGLFIVGFGNALPEIYFGIVAARKGEGWMVLGDLMGAIIIPATLVLGIVAIISPITFKDFRPFWISFFTLFLAALFFFFTVRSDQRLTKKEGLILLTIYLLFLFLEILIR